MRRVTLVIALGVVMAAMIALTVGSALAKDTDLAEKTYTDTVSDGLQYNAVPILDPNGVGTGTAQFRATKIVGDLFPEEDPGELDATLYYTGRPGPNVTTEIIGGTWILCSEFAAPPRDPVTRELIEPVCPEGSEVSLTGTISEGTANWDAHGGYANVGPLLVYAGTAKFKATLVVNENGTVNDESVTGGKGNVEGKIDHTPFLETPPGQAKITGTVKLRLF